MAESFVNSQDGQRSDVPEQTNSGTALNGTSGDIEMSEDTALPPQPANPTTTIDRSLTTFGPNDQLSTNEPPPSIPTASTATPPTAAAASPGPTQSTVSMPRNSSNPPTTPSTVTLAPPPAPSPHGSPTRVYLNQNVTPHLLEAVKHLAVYEPEKPLKWLAEFLGERSREVEGT